MLDTAALEKKWDAVLEPIFRDSVKHYDAPEKIETKTGAKFVCAPANKTAKPKVLIPAFPGTNGEYR